jgi:hypothetical protein
MKEKKRTTHTEKEAISGLVRWMRWWVKVASPMGASYRGMIGESVYGGV